MRNNKVNRNKITRSNTYLYDCGSIYTLSAQPYSEVAYNYIVCDRASLSQLFATLQVSHSAFLQVNQVLLYGSLYHDAKSGTCITMHLLRRSTQ
jgi:hypothetical protein